MPERPRVVVIMPARNSAKTLESTFRAIPPGVVDHVLLVDNASRDDTVAVAERLGITVVRHPVDRGFGGSIKTCFRTALAAGADLIVELHPDNQYDPRFIPDLVAEAGRADHAMVLGSRFLPTRMALEGGMPWWKYVNNRMLTYLNGRLLGVRLSEFHSGYRVYRAAWARTVPLDGLSDDFALAFELIAHAVDTGWSIGEVPANCRYFDEASSNSFRSSVVYGTATLRESVRVFIRRIGRAVRHTGAPPANPSASARR